MPQRLLSPVAASFMLAAAAAVTTGLGASWSSRAVADATNWVSHTREVQASLAEVLSLLSDAETGQRGYLLTGDPAYLEPYEQARRAIPGSIDHLQDLTKDNPAQQQRLRRLRDLARERLSTSTEAVALVQEGDRAGAVALLATGRGKRAMDGARAEVAAMRSDEDRLLRERLQDVERTRARGGEVAGLTTALLLALLGSVYATWQRSTDRIRGALDASESARRELEFVQRALDRSAMVVVGDPHGRLLQVNDEFVRASGYPREALVGREHTALGTGFARAFYEALRAGSVWRGELHSHARDGRELWTDSTVVPLLDAGGHPERFIAIHHDITDRKQAELELRDAQALVQAIVDGSTALVFAKDLQGRYFLTNDAWRRLAGLSPEQAQGVTDVRVFGEETATRLRESDSRVVAAGEPVLVEESAVVGDRPVTYLTSKFPLRDADGEVYAVCGVATDITELKRTREEVQQLNADLERRVQERTRQLTEANEELEAFSYTVSHDLRAPLRGLQGFAQAVHEDYADRLDDQGRDYLGRIMAAARRMEGLIQDLLEYGRLSRDQVHLREVSLDVALGEAVAQLAPEIRRLQADVRVEGPLPAVKGHPVVLQQVLANLLGNALKFHAAGQPSRVRVRAERHDGRVRTLVEDNGIGIRPEHQERIFRVFERLHGQEAFPGTGVGLAIVRKGCERMGGRCGVSSHPGSGSTFWFELDAA